LADMAQLIADELNVKQVTFSAHESDVVAVSAKPNYRRLGKVFGAGMRDAAREIEALDAEKIDMLEHGGTLDIMGHEIGFDDIEVRRTKREGVEVETEGEITAALNTEITPDLLHEGMAREFVNRLQNIRKQRDFSVTDRISVRYSCPDELREAIHEHEQYVRAETLALDLSHEESIGDKQRQTVEVNGMRADVMVEIAGPRSGAEPA